MQQCFITIGKMFCVTGVGICLKYFKVIKSIV